MEWVFIAILVLGIPASMAIWLIARAFAAQKNIEDLSRRVEIMEVELRQVIAGRAASPSETIQALKEATRPTPRPEPSVVRPAPAREVPRQEAFVSPHPPAAPASFSAPGRVSAMPPPPPIQAPSPANLPRPQAPLLPKINWEQFMGVKLFAWIGGLALFLGVAFFIKYSFDNNLVAPQLRVALGFLAGLGLLVGGVVMSRKRYAALSQTLCATGIVILYAVTFACHSVYHFEFFGALPTFLLMALITTTAFLLAVRLDALVVAILGMLGGFLTPALLSTGQDNPFGLFGYIAVLDAGLLVVALNRRWFFLAALAAAGTVIMEAGWAATFFEAGKYFEGNKILIALGVLLGFSALYLAACAWAKKQARLSRWFWGATLGLAAVAFAFTFWFLAFPPLAQRPWLMFGFVFLIDLVVTGLVLLDEDVIPAHPIAGLAVFGLLAFWTAALLRSELLNAGLVFYFLLAVLHSVFPVWNQRRRGSGTIAREGLIFPPLALVLVLLPIFKLAEVSFLVWPFVLLVDLVAIGLAVLTFSVLPIIIVLALTLGATGALIFKIPETLTGLPVPFLLLGAFSVFFVAAGVWLARRFKPEVFKAEAHVGDDLSVPANLAVQVPGLSAVLPFLLLIMATLRLPLSDPAPVFGLALLLVVLLLGVTRLFSMNWMPAIGLACVAALESSWHFKWFAPANASGPLAWYLVFLGVFTLFPFLFRRRFANSVVPWATAALAGPAQFFLIHRLMVAAHPNPMMGLLPAAFALPPLLSLVGILKTVPATEPARITQLAWFGGTALFFITLIFPIQFDRQWLTIGWALEGAALLWLFHRLPHPGLRLAGVGLLVVTFVRLAINPAVLEYHPRSATAILNWYLYSYGIVTVCLFAGARLLAPPRQKVLGLSAPPLLNALGTVLAFLLLNIQIADFFSEPGSTLTFQFSGDFARDMTYSIAWALFALALLMAGILRKTPAARYGAMGLLSVTVLKLFFHDLANLGQLYRIGAFVGVAVIAMLASLAYQRFFNASVKKPDNEPPQPPQ